MKGKSPFYDGRDNERPKTACWRARLGMGNRFYRAATARERSFGQHDIFGEPRNVLRVFWLYRHANPRPGPEVRPAYADSLANLSRRGSGFPRAGHWRQYRHL